MTRSPGLIVSFLFLLIATQLMLAPAFVAGDDHPSVDVELDQDMEEVGNQPPIAVITHVFRSRVNFSESVVLRGMGVDNDGYIIQYRWWSDLDGNLSSASGEVVFDDLSVGEHVISFAVKDQLDNWSQPDQVNVTVMPRVVPSVTHIRHYPYYVKVGEGVRFYAYTNPSDPSIQRYKWDLEGDGLWDSLTGSDNIYYRYTTSGHYCPTVMVMDEDGQWSEPYHVSLQVRPQSYHEREGESEEEAALGGLCLLFLVVVVPLATYKWGAKRQRKRCQDKGHQAATKTKQDPVKLMNEALALEAQDPNRALPLFRAANQKRSDVPACCGIITVLMILLLVLIPHPIFFIGVVLGMCACLLATENPTRKSARELAPLGVARCYLRSDAPGHALGILRKTNGLNPFYLDNLYAATRSLARGNRNRARYFLGRAYRIPRPNGPAFYYLSLGLTQTLMEWQMQRKLSASKKARKTGRTDEETRSRKKYKVVTNKERPKKEGDKMEGEPVMSAKDKGPATSKYLLSSEPRAVPTKIDDASQEPKPRPEPEPAQSSESSPAAPEPAVTARPAPQAKAVVPPPTGTPSSSTSSSTPAVFSTVSHSIPPSSAEASPTVADTSRKWRSARSGSVWRQSRFEGLTLAPSALMELVEWVMEGLDLERIKPSVTQVPGHFIGLIRYFAHDHEGRPHGVQLEVIGGLNRTRLLIRVYAPDDKALEELHALVQEELSLRLEVATPAASPAASPATSPTDTPVQKVSGDYVCGSKTEVKDSVVSRWGRPVTG